MWRELTEAGGPILAGVKVSGEPRIQRTEKHSRNSQTERARAGETARWLKALVTLPEAPSSVPRIYVRQLPVTPALGLRMPSTGSPRPSH